MDLSQKLKSVILVEMLKTVLGRANVSGRLCVRSGSLRQMFALLGRKCYQWVMNN